MSPGDAFLYDFSFSFLIFFFSLFWIVSSFHRIVEIFVSLFFFFLILVVDPSSNLYETFNGSVGPSVKNDGKRQGWCRQISVHNETHRRACVARTAFLNICRNLIGNKSPTWNFVFCLNCISYFFASNYFFSGSECGRLQFWENNEHSSKVFISPFRVVASCCLVSSIFLFNLFIAAKVTSLFISFVSIYLRSYWRFRSLC